MEFVVNIDDLQDGAHVFNRDTVKNVGEDGKYDNLYVNENGDILNADFTMNNLTLTQSLFFGSDGSSQQTGFTNALKNQVIANTENLNVVNATLTDMDDAITLLETQTSNISYSNTLTTIAQNCLINNLTCNNINTNHLNSTSSNLQSQINAINTTINTLNTQLSNLTGYASLTNPNQFLGLNTFEQNCLKLNNGNLNNIIDYTNLTYSISSFPNNFFS